MLNLRNPAFLGCLSSGASPKAYEDFEGIPLGEWDGSGPGSASQGFKGVWVARTTAFNQLVATEDFESYPEGEVATLGDGTGWSGSWISRGTDFNQMVAIEDFESYSEGEQTDLSEGSGWEGGWVARRLNDYWLVKYDDFESYADQNPITDTLTPTGPGFIGSWVVKDSPHYRVKYDDFESYADQNPITDTLTPPNPGFLGSWVIKNY